MPREEVTQEEPPYLQVLPFKEGSTFKPFWFYENFDRVWLTFDSENVVKGYDIHPKDLRAMCPDLCVFATGEEEEEKRGRVPVFLLSSERDEPTIRWVSKWSLKEIP